MKRGNKMLAYTGAARSNPLSSNMPLPSSLPAQNLPWSFSLLLWWNYQKQWGASGACSVLCPYASVACKCTNVTQPLGHWIGSCAASVWILTMQVPGRIGSLNSREAHCSKEVENGYLVRSVPQYSSSLPFSSSLCILASGCRFFFHWTSECDAVDIPVRQKSSNNRGPQSMAKVHLTKRGTFSSQQPKVNRKKSLWTFNCGTPCNCFQDPLC